MKINYTYFNSLLIFVFNVYFAQAQLGFCEGNSGDPIFTEDFGSGTTFGPALPTGTTNYIYVQGRPSDGQYTISRRSDYFGWHSNVDHTPGDTNGKYFIINASFTAGEFYNRTVTGLCENTTYEFSSWLINLLPPTTNCPNGGIPINVRFQIWDSSNTQLLASGDTGDISGTAAPDWNQYGLVFTTEPGQTSVILKMLNNGVGGCGNDLAIDDIVFKTCGDFTTLEDSSNETIFTQCEDLGPASRTLTATPDFSVFSSHYYQWQESNDETTWADVPGETTSTYTTPLVSTSTYYRVKIAEDPINVNNNLCNIVSETFSLLIIPIPSAAISNGNVTTCEGEMAGLSIDAPAGITANWYDAPAGGNILEQNTLFFQTDTAGTFYAEAISEIGGCISPTRTAIEAIFNPLPIVNDENLIFCETQSITLSAGTTGNTYVWSTGETTENIIVDSPDTYTVTVTNPESCSVLKTIVLEQIDSPVIENIESNNEDIEITLANAGEYEYSINNGPYQNSPIFELIEGGGYTINVRGINNCPVVSQDFIHFVIPKFFTPNGDSYNDLFIPQGIELFSTFEINIYNRYGTLLASSKNNSFHWNGTFNGKELPASDYWYTIKTDETIRKGHFSLIR